MGGISGDFNGNHISALRLSELRRSRGDHGHVIRGARGGRVVVRGNPLRAAVRQPAVRRREHPVSLQKDQGRDVLAAEPPQCADEGPHSADARSGPDEAHHDRGDQEAPLVSTGNSSLSHAHAGAA